MTPEEHKRVRQIYERAVSLAGDVRLRFLEEACAAQPEFRREVDKLLAARERVPDWLTQPALGKAMPPLHLELPKMEGRQLSGYTLLREIGRGGMGCVYLAERSDGAFERRVAIKIILPAANQALMIERFQQEREILASLDHPNIARLFDAGVTEEGWPYFVMEYVEGKPIHRWCDDNKLSVSRRIQLFSGVLAAVRYAHSHLVVHRDLKPGNIMVNDDGTVKLLDFGIAKILAPNPAGAQETVTLAAIMTPEYASPEQVNGSPVSTLSDVYSLGVILYELLTGHRPYRLLRAAMHEMARVISEEEPPRPSEVVTTTETRDETVQLPVTPDAVALVRESDPVSLRRRLAGDLDSILLMSLRKEPEQRYRSVESFADDLVRHLEHRPIAAREAPPWDRAKRFCRRNPGVVAAGVLVVMSLLAGAVTLIWQARHDLQNAPPNSEVFLFPVWAYFSAFTALALGAAIYFLRPSRRKLLASAAGGAAWGVIVGGKWWLEHHLGWWHSRFTETPDPLMVLSPWTWLSFPIFGMLFLLLLSAVGRRFGWKGQAIALLIFGPYQETRERAYFSVFLPALTYHPGLLPILAGAAMLIGGGVIGLLVMRLFCRPGPKDSAPN